MLLLYCCSYFQPVLLLPVPSQCYYYIVAHTSSLSFCSLRPVNVTIILLLTLPACPSAPCAQSMLLLYCCSHFQPVLLLPAPSQCYYYIVAHTSSLSFCSLCPVNVTIILLLTLPACPSAPCAQSMLLLYCCSYFQPVLLLPVPSQCYYYIVAHTSSLSFCSLSPVNVTIILLLILPACPSAPCAQSMLLLYCCSHFQPVLLLPAPSQCYYYIVAHTSSLSFCSLSPVNVTIILLLTLPACPSAPCAQSMLLLYCCSNFQPVLLLPVPSQCYYYIVAHTSSLSFCSLCPVNVTIILLLTLPACPSAPCAQSMLLLYCCSHFQPVLLLPVPSQCYYYIVAHTSSLSFCSLCPVNVTIILLLTLPACPSAPCAQSMLLLYCCSHFQPVLLLPVPSQCYYYIVAHTSSLSFCSLSPVNVTIILLLTLPACPSAPCAQSMLLLYCCSHFQPVLLLPVPSQCYYYIVAHTSSLSFCSLRPVNVTIILLLTLPACPSAPCAQSMLLLYCCSHFQPVLLLPVPSQCYYYIVAHTSSLSFCSLCPVNVTIILLLTLPACPSAPCAQSMLLLYCCSHFQPVLLLPEPSQCYYYIVAHTSSLSFCSLRPVNVTIILLLTLPACSSAPCAQSMLLL